MKKKDIDIVIETNQLIKLLKGKKAYTRDELCAHFNITLRTLQRRLQTIRENNKDLYLNKTSAGFQILPITSSISSKPKKRSSDKAVNYLAQSQKDIDKISRAIKTKHFIALKNYLPNNGNLRQSYELAPIKLMLDRDPGQIIAIKSSNLSTLKLQTFNLGQFESVKILERTHQLNLDKTLIKFDDFGMMYQNEGDLKYFDLYLSSYSRRMLYHDFPHFKDRIVELTDRQTLKRSFSKEKTITYKFKIQLKVAHIGAIGRLCGGMLDNIIIRSTNQEHLKELKTYIKNSVIEALESNFELN